MGINVEYNIIEILGWLGTASILFGYYLNAKKLEMSWVVWFLGNLFMLIYSINIKANPQVMLAVVLMVLNVYGYLNWRKLNK